MAEQYKMPCVRCGVERVVKVLRKSLCRDCYGVLSRAERALWKEAA